MKIRENQADANMSGLEFSLRVQSGPMAVRDITAQVKDHLKPIELDIEEDGTVELVLAEALNNIMEHAYPEGDKQGFVETQCALKSNGLNFQIEDFGHAMPDGTAPLGTEQNLDVDMMDLPEGGFGWFLIRDLAKDVEYVRIDNRNVLTFRIAIARR